MPDISKPISESDAGRSVAGVRSFFERFARQPAGRRRLLALLPVLGLSLAASGCIATPGYGHGAFFGDPYHGVRGSYYGARPYYSPQRTVVVQPRRVIVRQPKVRHHRIHRVVRPDRRHHGYRAERGPRIHRAVRPHSARHGPRYIDRNDSRRRPPKPFVRDHDRRRSEARGPDRRQDRRQMRDRERSRERTRSRTEDRRSHGRGRR